jgi:hypothetical protein
MSKPSLAFDEYARMQRRRFQLQSSDDVITILRRNPNASRALMEQEQLTQSDLLEILGFDERSELRDALTKLREAGFLRRVGSSFYVKTPAAITWLRGELSESTFASANGRPDAHGAMQHASAETDDDGERPPW